MKLFTATLLICFIIGKTSAEEPSSEKKQIKGKVLPIFQVVTFPNDPCDSDSARNGTCYTAEECSNRGGTTSGSCAEIGGSIFLKLQGFGVCCTFTVGCGSMINENCTYFTSTDLPDGPCSTRVCKCSSDICQIRLDFQTFVITGPSTRTVSIGKATYGELLTAGAAGDSSVTESSQCLTDTFTISNQNSVPLICGTNTGEHVYFEANDNCNNLNFAFGSTVLGVTAKATRQFDIKISQISCNSNMLAPEGCTQWYTGPGPAHVRTFNWDSGNGRHLANQEQTICVRRENGMCALCWNADAVIDVQLGANADAMAKVNDLVCCGYGAAGLRATDEAYDCLMIPGALKADDLATNLPVSQCGRSLGLVSADAAAAGATTGRTICTKDQPFRVRFQSDNWEYNADGATAADEGGSTGNSKQRGFKLRYTQKSC